MKKTKRNYSGRSCLRHLGSYCAAIGLFASVGVAHGAVFDAKFKLGTDISGNATGGKDLDLKISHTIFTSTGDQPVELALGAYPNGNHVFYVSSKGVGAKSGGTYNIQISDGSVSLLSAVGALFIENGNYQFELMSMPRSDDSHFLFLKWTPKEGIQTTDVNEVAVTHISAAGRIDDFGSLDYTNQATQIDYSPGVKREINGNDSATGTGYIMYTAEAVYSRFTFPANYGSRNQNFIAVIYDEASSSWKYDDNTAYVAFTPQVTDVLVAGVDFTNNTRTLYTGLMDHYNGIRLGYLSGDFGIIVDHAANSSGEAHPNSGEFYVEGTQINFHTLSSAFLTPEFEVKSIGSSTSINLNAASVNITQPQGDIAMGDFGN